MTILAVPATSVPSERVFSLSGRTATKSCNRISLFMMEVLQVLKFNHRNGILDFSSLFFDDPDEMEAVLPEETTETDLINEIHNAESLT